MAYRNRWNATDQIPLRAVDSGLIDRLGPEPVVLCTHGDVVEALVGEGEPKKKGSTWLLARRNGAVEAVRYWPPLA